MATSWISFGPDLEPLESESRRGAQTPGRRRDGISVSGAPEELVARLVEAAGASAGWCRFDEALEDGVSRPVFVNAGAVRMIAEED
jgi:hypothetical protein